MSSDKRKRRIIVEETIAEGGYSVVHKGRDQDTLESLAIKDIDLTDENGQILFRTEVRIMKRLPKHRNLPALIGHSKTGEVGSIVMTYLPYPTLTKYIEEKGSIPADTALFILKQILEAIRELAKVGVVHRDIKSDNMLINPASKQIVLVDFGLAMTEDELNEDSANSEFIGTPIYMSPAILRGHKHRLISSDLWSAGVVFLEMLIGEQPFKDVESREELLGILASGLDFHKLGTAAQVVLQGLLAFEETDRSNLEDTLMFLRRVIKAAPAQRKSISESLTHAFTKQKLSA